MFREIAGQVRDVVRAFVAQGVRDGAFSVGNEQLAADLVSHAVDGQLTRLILEESDPEVGEAELVAALTEMMRRTLGLERP